MAPGAPAHPHPHPHGLAHPEPVPAVRAALRRVREHLAGGASDVLLLGPAGVGKTLLLRQLAASWPGRVSYCPFLHFEPEEAARWLASIAGAAPGTGAEELASALAAGSAPGGADLLLLDEAQAIPEATLDALLGWSDAAGLRRVWAGVEGTGLQRIPARLGPELARVPLVYRLDADEARAELEGIACDPTLSPDERRSVSRLLEGPLDGVGDVPGEIRRQVGTRLFRASRRTAAPVTPPVRLVEPASVAVAGPSPAAPAPPLPAAVPPRAITIACETPPSGPPGTAARDSLSQPDVIPTPAEAPAPAPAPAPAAVATGVPPWRRPVLVALAIALGIVALLVLGSLRDGATRPTAAVVPPAPVLVDINAVPWAHIFVDGEEVGVTPIGELPLAPGPHLVEARFADGERLSRTAEVGTAKARISFRR